jgi:hypothetical protein
VECVGREWSSAIVVEEHLVEDDSPRAFQLIEALLGKKPRIARIKAPTVLMGGSGP